MNKYIILNTIAAIFIVVAIIALCIVPNNEFGIIIVGVSAIVSFGIAYLFWKASQNIVWIHKVTSYTITLKQGNGKITDYHVYDLTYDTVKKWQTSFKIGQQVDCYIVTKNDIAQFEIK